MKITKSIQHSLPIMFHYFEQHFPSIFRWTAVQLQIAALLHKMRKPIWSFEHEARR